MSSNRDGSNEINLGDFGAPDYGFDRHQEPDPNVSVFERYGEDPDSLGGVSAHDHGRVLGGEPGPGEEDDDVAPADEHIPGNEHVRDDALHGAGAAGEGQHDATDQPDEDRDEQATSGDQGDKPGTVIEVFIDRPNPPTPERQALITAIGRVHRVIEGNQLPPSVKTKLLEPTDASTVAVLTRIAVANAEAQAAAEGSQSPEAADADLAAKGKVDPEHLRNAMQQSGPSKFMDALGEVDTERDILNPITEAKGFGAALKNADPDAFLQTVRERSPRYFWYGDPKERGRQAADGSAKPRYIGLLLDPAFAGRTPAEAKANLEAEGLKLVNLMHLHSGARRSTDPERDVTAVKSYIDGLNETERDWLVWHGRGDPGDTPGQRLKQTVSPHHADRLERFLTFARPRVERVGEHEADLFTAKIIREIAEARIEIRRQAQYRDGTEAYGRGQRVNGLSAEDLESLALAARFDERAAKNEQAKDSNPAQVIRDCWDDVIAREDRLYQADLRQRRPDLFEPGVPPPVSPRHFTERLGQIGYNFRARLGDHMEGPDPEQHGRASANAGLLVDLEELMAERERTREEIRLARSPNPARFMGGDRPNGLSDEQIRDWAILTAVQLDVAMQPESGGAGTEAEVLVQAVTDVTVRDMALRQNAAHQANPGDLRSGRLPMMTPADVRTLVEMAAMSAGVTVQQSGHQAAHEFIAQTANDLHQLLRGRDAHDLNGGDLARILRGDLQPGDLLRMSEPALMVARNAAAQAVEESLRQGLPPDPDAARRYQLLEDHMLAIEQNQGGALATARAGAQADSAQRAVDAHNRPENAVHITSGPGPEHPEFLVALAAGLGYGQITVSGTNPLNRQLGIVAGREISPTSNPDLVAQTSGYRSAETHIIQGRAPATVDPHQLLKDPNVRNIIIRDIPQNGNVINTILHLIDDTNPRALFHNQFSVAVGPTGWVDPSTLVLSMSGNQTSDGSIANQQMTVWFVRNQAA